MDGMVELIKFLNFLVVFNLFKLLESDFARLEVATHYR